MEAGGRQVEAQARLRPAVSASRLPTSTSAALSAASSSSHLAAYHSGNGGNDKQMARAIVNPISSATMSRPATAGPSIAGGRLLARTAPIGFQKAGLVSRGHYQGQQMNCSSPGSNGGQATRPNPYPRATLMARAAHQEHQQQLQQPLFVQSHHSSTVSGGGNALSTASAGETKSAPSHSFQVINGCVHIDIPMVAEELSQMRHSLEELVITLKSEQKSRENIERENQLLRREVEELRLRLGVATAGGSIGSAPLGSVCGSDRVNLDSGMTSESNNEDNEPQEEPEEQRPEDHTKIDLSPSNELTKADTFVAAIDKGEQQEGGKGEEGGVPVRQSRATSVYYTAMN